MVSYNNIHLAIMAIEGASKEMNIPSHDVYMRLKNQGLIHNYLIKYYDELHTQSAQWLSSTTVETLKNWEAAR